MDRKFLFGICGTKSKKIPLQPTDVTVPKIREILKTKFEIRDTGAEIKYFDNDVEDWVDFESDSEESIENLKVIKVKISLKHFVSSEATLTENDHVTRAPELPSITHVNVPSNKRSTIISSPTRPLTPASGSTIARSRSTSPASRPVTPSSNSSTSRDADVMPAQKGRKEWPRQYKVPKENIPKGVTTKLDNKEELTTGERRILLETIYNDITKYKGGMYPTSEMYEEITDALIREFPHLLSSGGLPATSARAYWKDKIIFKFGNARKSFDQNNPEVLKRKRKKAPSAAMESRSEERIFTWGLGKYLPEPPASEDETSTNMHVQALKREFRKTGPDVDMFSVDQKMALTFSYRRKLVVNEKMSVAELTEKFPWLKLRCEILKEFERLDPNLSTPDLENEISKGLRKFTKPILSLLKAKKKGHFLQEVERTLTHFRTADQRQYAEDCLALAGLPILFKERPEDVIKFDVDGECPIYILIKDKLLSMGEEEFTIHIEGTIINGCENFFQAYVTLIAGIYTFNLVYPPKLVKTLTFVQNVLVGLKDQQGQINLDRRIINVLASLNSINNLEK